MLASRPFLGFQNVRDFVNLKYQHWKKGKGGFPSVEVFPIILCLCLCDFLCSKLLANMIFCSVLRKAFRIKHNLEEHQNYYDCKYRENFSWILEPMWQTFSIKYAKMAALFNIKKWFQIYSTFAKGYGKECDYRCLCNSSKKNDLQINVAYYSLSIHLFATVEQLNHAHLNKN